MAVLNFEPKSEPNKLRCTSCGTTTEAPCGCGVPYEMLRPARRAEIGIKETPHLSNMAIAKRVGVSDVTVGKVRKQVRVDFGPDEREGVDGKIYPMPKDQIWPPERDAKLVQLTEQGMTDPQIAEELGTTAGAVSGRRVRINDKIFSPANYRLPPRMPDDILLQTLEQIRIVKLAMRELDAFSAYANQMHDDTRHRIAEEMEAIYSLSRDIIKRLVGGVREIKPVACGVELKVRKED